MNAGYIVRTGLWDYQEAWDTQRQLHKARVAGEIEDTLVLTEHPHTYTTGKAGREENLLVDERRLAQDGIAVHRIDRGGDITYHGPGQIVGYPILDLHNYYLDVHRFLRDIEEVIIRTLPEYDIAAGRSAGLTGVWVNGAKIAAIGIKVSRWVTMHGFAFNVNTDLDYFGNIVPCGITDKTVTSLEQLVGQKVDLATVQERVAQKFAEVFDIMLEEMSLDAILRRYAAVA